MFSTTAIELINHPKEQVEKTEQRTADRVDEESKANSFRTSVQKNGYRLTKQIC